MTTEAAANDDSRLKFYLPAGTSIDPLLFLDSHPDRKGHRKRKSYIDRVKRKMGR